MIFGHFVVNYVVYSIYGAIHSVAATLGCRQPRYMCDSYSKATKVKL